MSSNTSEKTEQPTQFRLQEARKKGQLAKSMEVTGLTVITVFVLVVSGYGINSIIEIAKSTQATLDLTEFAADKKTIFDAIKDSFTMTCSMLFSLSAIAVVAGILGNILQTGIIFSSAPLKWDIQKINPIKGFKKLFSIKSLFDLLKSVIKIAILVTILYLYHEEIVSAVIRLHQQELYQGMISILHILSKLCITVIGLLLALSILDYLFTRKQYIKQLKMTKQEVKDEYKRREGDPLIKQKRKELQNKLRQQTDGLNNVKNSDVVITNPTHIAVAISYQRNKMDAPKVVAMGADNLAKQIRYEAAKASVPIIEKPTLARALYKKAVINSTIPESTFLDIAIILHKIYQQRNSLTKTEYNE
ncbi:EscU/YscU/HrcU family type III secretion system export apparatus switch protein [Zooshikella marina]|uniref:Flagellar type III secretion system protein FlhB n=1 Tax=Zooshikella ganghwensis TaxID=202772 RepID=A0A4P9VS78_9GAMM|nr:EscU/YscU/HrcU family type III secretion system export apparatus switch protein [Zooshikella ganghwensis]MBU2705923.1 EscU/YscU/HrcU family type III secretion system export apparatus switch protein [Zooshikella ganghwensis]RDH46463.1 flagellar type III secretion system protein FlhB [Zooshikella ganghwensis]